LATAPNQKFVVVPMETSGLLGSLAGIGELTREVWGDQNQRGTGRGPRGDGGTPRGTVPSSV